MADSMADRLSRIPLVNRKADVRAGEGRLPFRNPEAGKALESARAAAELEPKEMAGQCGVSDSLVRRALNSADDIGFHRLWELDDSFWTELLVAIAKRRRIAIVKTTIELHAEQKSRTA